MLVVPGTLVTLSHLRDLLTRLLQQLFARDSRRRFCPPDHWLIPTDISFSEAVLKEDSNIRQPCLDILHSIPFVIPFEVRVGIFREWVRLDRLGNGLDDQWLNPAARVTIRRQYVFKDGYTHLNALGSRLKNRVAITFISEQGLVEAGIDGGGVFKEFLTTLCRQAFDLNYGLFQATTDQLLYPSPHSYATQETQLKHLEFLGRILGKALYEGILVDVGFANFFLAKWLGRTSYLDDLPSLDPDLYQGLLFLKNYQGDVRDLGLTFSVDDTEFGAQKTIELIPNGSTIPVTNTNRIKYIYLMAHWKLNTRIERQCKAFFGGLVDLIDPSWVRMFNQQELQILLSGTPTPISLTSLREHTTYAGGYTSTHPTILLFWTVLEQFDEEYRRGLLRFVTSCAREPLLGFGELRPGFCIRFAGDEEDRLPTASTCVNLLKLPAYKSLEVMRA
ncbi:uncharacterized protein SPPG_06951 [Spizellomyces punctatus DAOM BR117]|uniref:HECT-type E3 ubiquitin transferase n=1 Tax=Spizellomyces punctatus (strain DAOM BR117) TaxID=645134 RepID=A0A0L0H9U9_SPIPD|nr:uncharacterized protein SPPG_06951 [Spizellomyces punctatus DAOM BR117]KNC97962.1 hypothetical protein SPPG_06951 [Spizellomyces punctatus DAOM BR117]|eukprot:XP_016606002.1 hypothetical protein SPPG_06951 [Spizellomyces punctatus DAOM BR117]